MPRDGLKFKIGDLVWKRNNIFSYSICKLRSPVVVEIETLDGMKAGKNIFPTPPTDVPVPSQSCDEAERSLHRPTKMALALT